MSLLRRFTAVLCALLLAQLTLREGYDSCTSHTEPQEHGRFADMELTHAAHAAAVDPARDGDCNTEQMPGACSSMPSCANVLTLPMTAVAGTTPCLTNAPPPEPVAIHSRPSAAPDAPPPRD
jgi:hypothetical protein